MKTKNNSMKKENRIIGKKVKLLFTVILLVGSMTANAQLDLPGGGDSNIPDAPIDGFLSIGLIAGACIGLRKHFKGIKE